MQVFAVTTSAVVLDALSIKEDSVVVLKSFDEHRNDMSVEAEFVVKDVTSFIFASTMPLVSEYSWVSM